MLVSWDVGKAGCSADLIVSEPEAERLFHLKPDLVLLFKTSYLTVLPLQATNTSQSSNAVLYGCTVSVCVDVGMWVHLCGSGVMTCVWGTVLCKQLA